MIYIFIWVIGALFTMGVFIRASKQLNFDFNWFQWLVCGLATALLWPIVLGYIGF